MARKRIGDLLVDTGLLTLQQLEEALVMQKKSKERLGDLLINSKMITEQQLIEVLEFQLGIPHLYLAKQKLDPSLLSMIPEALARRYRVFPVRKERNRLLLAMADPLDYFAIDSIRLTTGLQIDPAIASKDEIRVFIERYYGMQDAQLEVGAALAVESSQTVDQDLVNDDAPIVRLVNQIVTQAVLLGASDIHFDPSENGLQVRMRVDGLLRSERSLTKQMQNMVTARLKIMATLNIAERRLPQDGRFRIPLNGRVIDVRISTLPTVSGEKTVLRLLDSSSDLKTIQTLGFSEDNRKAYQAMLQVSSGMVLITGPTGSGKTTTLYAGLRERSTPAVNVITIEDPVEYQVPGMNQVAVNTATGMTFAKGLRSILRQDPDIVLVGEIRDVETAEIAIRAALTGHLVLSTLHTTDAISTVARLIDMGIEPYLVASALTGVVSQRLVRRICDQCKELYEPSTSERILLQKYHLDESRLVHGHGCSHCGGTGYRGRFAIHEVLRMQEPLRKGILQRVGESALQELAVEQKFRTLLEAGLQQAALGQTSVVEVLRVALRDEE